MKAKYQKPCSTVVNLQMDLTVLSGLSTSSDKSTLRINGPATPVADNGADLAEGRAPRPSR